MRDLDRALDLSRAARFHERMENTLLADVPGVAATTEPAACRPDVTLALSRGVARLFRDLGLAPMPEFRLPNGRRADLAGLCPKGQLVIAEIKSCEADFTADSKWEDYLDFCDSFYFAVAADFPRALLPEAEGLIIADSYGGAIIRPSVERQMAAARRKAITLRFARQAAARAALLAEDQAR